MGTPNKLPEFHPDLNGAGLKVGIAMSRFNIDVCEGLLGACVTELLKLGVAKEDIHLATVPGALEIPLVLQKMAKSGKFDALVALGAIVRGETYHFELVANESGGGVTRVMLDSGLPIANAILTTEDEQQALVRMAEKGADAARVVIEMANLLKKI
ncbi:MAG: 6,7-dimethyl-8-ribityllumazine synthase [Sulfurimicrobium sp.]|nr:6,7-dimethyl-8-ribityllumazine synthase [Sulfurimicrobium sp.]